MTTIEIKAEIFDIIVAQEDLQSQINQLQNLKQQRLQDLQQSIKATSKATEASNEITA